MNARAITVSGLADARLALAAARAAGTGVVLASGPGAGGYAGAAWFLALVRTAAEEFPDVPCEGLLDCADAAGDVLAALRAGAKAVRYAGPADVAARLTAIAAACGARLETAPVAALDLPPGRDAAAAARAWLARSAP